MPYERRYDSNAASQKQKYEVLGKKLDELSKLIQKDAWSVNSITTILNNGYTMDTNLSGDYYDKYITSKKLFIAELVKLDTKVTTAQNVLKARITTCNEKVSYWSNKIYYQVWVEPVDDKKDVKRLEV